MLTIEGLRKDYKDKRGVLKDICLEIPDGTVFGLVGADGIGKTTLLRILAGVLAKDEGRVCVDGADPYKNVACKRRVFYLAEEPFFAWNATPRSTADFYSAFYSLNRNTFDSYLRDFGIDANVALRNCSNGVRKQVFMALAFAVAPQYLLADEPFEGVDSFVQEIFQCGMRRLAEAQNGTVVLASRSFRGLSEVCDRFGILRQGELISSDDMQGDLRALHKFQAAFEGPISEGDFPFSCISFSQTGRVVRLVAKGEAEALKSAIERLRPIFVEEVEADFEELAIDVARFRGYLA